jgi:hypothetical protein
MTLPLAVFKTEPALRTRLARRLQNIKKIELVVWQWF